MSRRGARAQHAALERRKPQQSSPVAGGQLVAPAPLGEVTPLRIALGAARPATSSGTVPLVEPSTGAKIAALVGELGPDEQRVLLLLARRLLAGRKTYGPLDVAGDRRNFEKEAGEEAADMLVYFAFDWLKHQLGNQPPRHEKAAPSPAAGDGKGREALSQAVSGRL